MTRLLPAYRLTLYAPRSTDATETTILTPAAGAIHSDQFKVTTLPSLAGWKPYLATIPEGRTGRIDVLTKRTDVGQYGFELQDQRVGGDGSNSKRWVTAFFGDTLGRLRLMGLRAFAEESTDGGATWAPYWTGRCQALKSDGKTGFQLLVSDMSEDLKAMCYVGQPHFTVQGRAGVLSLLPLGPPIPYGSMPVPAPLAGVAQTVYLGLGIGIALSGWAQIQPSNVVTEELLSGTTAGGKNAYFDLSNIHTVPSSGTPLRAIVRHTSGALAGQVGTYKVGYLVTAARSGSGAQYVTTLEIELLDDTAAPGYLALPANGVTLELIATYHDSMIDEQQPLLIADQHPVQIIQDLALGYYGWLYKPNEVRPAGKALGDAKRGVTPNAASFAALLADTSFGTLARKYVEETSIVVDEIENICATFQLGWYLNALGELVLVDLRIPTVTPSLELTDADVIADRSFEWEVDRAQSVQRVTAKYVYEYRVPPEDADKRGGTLPTVADALIRPLEAQVEVLDVGTSDLGDQLLTIDAQTIRFMDDELINGVARADYVRALLGAIAKNLTYPLGSGGIYATLALRRTGAAASLVQGALVKVTVSWLPDLWTKQRGGTRVMRCCELSPAGLGMQVRLLDYGSGSVCATPSLGAPSQQTSNTSHGASIQVTSNAAGDSVELQVAVLAGGSAPVAGSPLWHSYGPYNPIRNTSAPPWVLTPSSQGLPAGARVWFRARSLPAAYNQLQQASGWVVSSSVDLVGISAPSGLSTSGIGSTKFSLAFTPAAGQRTEIRLAQKKNQLTRSEELDHADWGLVHSTIVANAVTAPDGTLTADKVKEDSGNFSHTAFSPGAGGITIVAGEQIAVSCYAKAEARTKVRLSGRNAGNGFDVDFDLSLGTILARTPVGSGTLLFATIEPVYALGTGWYRLKAGGTLGGAITAAFFDFWLLNGAGSDTYTGDGTSGAYCWGAQLERAAIAPSAYIKTVAAATYEPLQLVATLLPGASSHELVGLDPGTIVSLDLRSTDGVGGYSSSVSTTVTLLAAGSDAALPDMDGLNLTKYTP